MITRFLFGLMLVAIFACRSQQEYFKHNMKSLDLAIALDFENNIADLNSTSGLKTKKGLRGKSLELENNNVRVSAPDQLSYPYTISIWFKGQGWLASNHVKCSLNKTWGIDIDKFDLFFITYREGKTQTTKLKHNLNTNSWSHLILVCKSPTEFDFFVNGAQLSSIKLTKPLPEPNNTFFLGSSGCAVSENNYSGSFYGEIDEFKLITRPLTQQEIRKLSIIDSQGLSKISKVANKKSQINFKVDKNQMLSWKVKGMDKLISHFEIVEEGNTIDSIWFDPYSLEYTYINLIKKGSKKYSLKTIGEDGSTLATSEEVLLKNEPLESLYNQSLEGFTASAKFGQGGILYRVTNLSDSGPGSLRYGLEKILKPRIIIFEISGLIYLKKPISITSPFVSIYGQTALDDGIHVTNAGIKIKTHDVLIQHLTIRPADSKSSRVHPTQHDGITIMGEENGNPKKKISYNIVIDHCSISWAKDENVSLWYNGISEVTISNCIISEALNKSDHPKGAHSKGLLIGPNSKNIAIIKNVFYNNVERNPAIQGNSDVLIVNNLIYGCKDHIRIEDTNKNGPINAVMKLNIASRVINNLRSTIGLSKITMNPNEAHNLLSLDSSNPRSIRKRNSSNIFNKTFLKSILKKTYKNKSILLNYLMENAGANAPRRSQTDARVIQKILNGELPKPIDCIYCKEKRKKHHQELSQELKNIPTKEHNFVLPDREEFDIQKFDQNKYLINGRKEKSYKY